MQNMPVEKDGFTPTLNNMGYMCSQLDEISNLFVQESINSSLPCLEIGAAYGVAALSALRLGSKVIANDLDERHLLVLEEACPEEYLDNLTILPGRFPEEINIEDNTVSSVLISRVLHFFTGQDIVSALKKVYQWLVPGGKVFIVNETPYLKNWINLIPFYEEKKKIGEKYPGEFTDLDKYTDSFRVDLLPKFFHFLDVDVLGNIIRDAGFVIETSKFISRPYFPEDLVLDGRESVGVVACKK